MPGIGPDADGEFLNYVALDDEDLYVIAIGDTPVGLALAAAEGEDAFLYPYIFPDFRGRGYGADAATLLEERLRTAGARKIQTCCRCGHTAAERLARRRGYRPQYASSYLVFTGSPWELPELPVRAYRPSDFAQAHGVYAQAFHAMRLTAGCFPDTVLEQPDARTAARWEETADQRFVYTRGSEILGLVQLEGDEIGCVAVKPTHQGNGIGTLLVKFAVNRLLAQGKSAVSLYCVVGNPALRLYQKLHFTERCRNTYAQLTL